MSPKVFLALPIYGDVSPLFMNSMLRLMANPPCPIEVSQEMGNSCIQNSRNSLTAAFLETTCTHILFIDSDTVFTPEHIALLLSRDVPIVSALIAKKKDGPIEWALCGSEEMQTWGDLIRVKNIGAGMILIKREVFERMAERFGEAMRYDLGSTRTPGKPEYEFWGQGIYPGLVDGKRIWMGEDFYFCQRATDCGFVVWADTKVVAPHIGRAIYPMKHQTANGPFRFVTPNQA